MSEKNKNENGSDADKSAKIIREAKEVRNLIEKKKIQNNILKKLIGNIPKASDSSLNKSDH